MIKLTIDDIVERLSKKSISLIGEYVNSRTKTQFMCNLGHTWTTSLNNVLHQTGCPQCSNRSKLTKETINSRLSSRGISLASDNMFAGRKSTFICANNHTWSARLNSVLHGQGCPHCAVNFPLNCSIVNDRLTRRRITMVGDYVNAHTKTTFSCADGHTWQTTPASVSGCPFCKVTGFSYEKPAYAYILEFETFLKYGISNSIESRLQNHKANGIFNLKAKKYFSVGADAAEWERNVKQTLGGRFVTKEVCIDGYTETLPLTLLDKLLETLN